MKRIGSKPIHSTYIVWLIGVAASALAGWFVHTDNQIYRQERFEALSDELSRVVTDRFQLYEYGLRGARGAIATAGGVAVTRRQFEAYVATRDFAREFPGARGFGYIERVRADELQRFLSAARADDAPDFAIAALAPREGERFIIKYVYPRDANRAATGLDIASETHRREAALAAARKGQTQLSAPVTLVQATGKPNQGFLMLMPIYRNGAAVETEAEREAASIGWSYAPLLADEVLRDMGPRATQASLTLTDSAGSAPFYARADAERPTLQTERRIEIFGRSWSMVTRPTRAFYAAHPVSDPILTAAALAALVTLACTVFFVLLRSRQRRLELKAEQEGFEANIVDAAPHGLLVIDQSGKIARANLAAAETFGYRVDQLIGMPMDELVPPAAGADPAERRDADHGAHRQGTVPRHLTGWRRDGTPFDLSIQLSPVEIGGRRHVIAGVSDISDQLAARAVLAESEQRWQQVANSLAQLVWTCDANGACDFLSKRWEDYTGLPAHAHLGSGWLACIHPDDRPAMVELWARSLEAPEPFHVELRLRRHDGSYRWFDTRAVPLLDADGRTLRWIGSNTDVQERRSAEDQVRALLERMEGKVAARTAELETVRRDLRNVVDAIPSMIAYWDRSLVNRFTNKAYEDWYGVESGALIGRRMREVLGEELFALNAPMVEATLAGEAQRFERELTNAAGITSVLQVHYLPDARDGAVHGFYVLISDVTDLKRSERSLARARDAAEAATRAKSVFLTSMSHELRTPMNSVLGFTDLMLKAHYGPLNNKQAEFMHLIHASARHLLKLMDDVLELSKIEAGRMTVSLEAVHVTPVLTSVIANLQAMAEQKGIRFAERYLHASSLAVRADATRLMQALINLGSNAIKYNRPGGRVELSCVEIGDHVRIRVSDQGFGIPADRQRQLFQPFNRLGAEQGAIEGTGIGLALTKRLVEMMGGAIGFESLAGAGSTFWIDMPIDQHVSARGALAQAGPGLPQIGRPIRLLHVEDNEQNRILFRNYFALIPDLEVIEAPDGRSGLERARTEHPDVVILDINLPGFDGYQVLNRMKADRNLKHVPVIALTANAMAADVERGLAAGFDRYLTKPIALDELVGAIAACTGGGRPRDARRAG